MRARDHLPAHPEPRSKRATTWDRPSRQCGRRRLRLEGAWLTRCDQLQPPDAGDSDRHDRAQPGRPSRGCSRRLGSGAANTAAPRHRAAWTASDSSRDTRNRLGGTWDFDLRGVGDLSLHDLDGATAWRATRPDHFDRSGYRGLWCLGYRGSQYRGSRRGRIGRICARHRHAIRHDRNVRLSLTRERTATR